MSRSTKVVALVGVGFIAIILFAAVFAPILSEHPPNTTTGLPFQEPSADHLLGTDDLGRDLWSQLLFGARISLGVGLIAAVIATAVGTVVALVAGYRGGTTDAVLMRIVDLVLSLPFLVLVLVLVTYFGRGLSVTIALIAGVLWARPARLLRGQVLKVKEFEHVVAAEAMGASLWRILGRHILPRLTPLVSSQFVRAAAVAVIVQSGIAFLGLGDPGSVSWGATLFFANNSGAILTDAWKWWILPPGFALTILIVGFAFIGYAAEEWADPRLTSYGYQRGLRRTLSPQPAAPAGEGESLVVRKLSVQYETEPPVLAATSVDLRTRTGRILGIVGESGSGKSTMAMAIAGLLAPPGRIVDGEVVLGDTDLRRLGRIGLTKLRGRRFAVVPQAAMSLLDPIITIRRQVAESALMTRSDGVEYASELLSRVGIAPDRHDAYPHELSGGMRQRVVIAMAIANQPELLIADEPTTGLDVVTQRELLDLLKTLRSELDMDILIISHDLRMVGNIADDLAIMYAGRIAEFGEAETVLRSPRHPYTELLLNAFPPVLGPRRPPVPIPGDPPDLSRLEAGCPFAPRCPKVFDACLETVPEYVPVACHLVAT